jgi:hypothetical protein
MPGPKLQEADEQLISMFVPFTPSYLDAKKCAIAAIKLHLRELDTMKLIFSDRVIHYAYWEGMKKDLESK